MLQEPVLGTGRVGDGLLCGEGLGRDDEEDCLGVQSLGKQNYWNLLQMKI